MSKFAEFQKSCATTGSASSGHGPYVKITAKQCLQARAKGPGQLALVVNVPENREAFGQVDGPITVKVDGLEAPVVLNKTDSHLVWFSSQDKAGKEGFEALFNLLFTEDFASKVEGLAGIEDEVSRRRRAKKVRSVISAEITWNND